MTWTTSTDLKNQVQRLWDRGLLLAALSDGRDIFPRRMTMKGPDSRELSERFAEVRDWIAQLSEAADYYRIKRRTVNHRVLGTNEIPSEIWIDSLENALDFIGKRQAAEHYSAMVALTGERRPELIPWLAGKPLRALKLFEDWPRLLDIVGWLSQNPRPAIYLRQIDLPGVHSKFIEGHRGVLGELLDIALPPEAIDSRFTGVSGFCRRYGFRDKPLRVRFRILDPELAIAPTGTDQDITLDQETFAELDMPVKNIFITENEINFLAFPKVAHAIVIFGAGYGFENLASVNWLRERTIYYWGDIDTHGFAILNQLREFLPQAGSLLMDQRTLLTHRPLWGFEPNPETRVLIRLTDEESALYDRLRKNQWGDRIRLEQERIGYDFLIDTLLKL